MPKDIKLKDALLNERLRLMECIMKSTDSNSRSANEISLQSINEIINICMERNRF